MTAEHMRSKGLGRCPFRLEEEWTTDTVSRNFINARYSEHRADDSKHARRSTAKVSIVKSSKTKKEILYAQGKETTPTNNNDLFHIFLEALAQHGSQFDSLTSPVVAGLILDSHYSRCDEQVLGHVSTGRHDYSGISLATLGCHLTHSWPRFIEEINSCLTDARISRPKSLNGRGGNSTLWESCAFSQSSFLHAVGLAFGASSDSSSYRKSASARGWQKQFLSGAKELEESSEDAGMTGCAAWDLGDATNLRLSPHFALPMDNPYTEKGRAALPLVKPEFSENDQGELETILRIASPIRIGRLF